MVQYPPILASLVEARSYSCLLGQLPKDLASGVFQLQRQIDPRDLKNPTFEEGEQPHVTVLYGLHTRQPNDVFLALRKANAVRPATFKLGRLDVFRHRDQDVLKINVESPDLQHLHAAAKKLPNSFSFPKYEPHVTVAYLQPGRGEKYLSLSNPLEGREHTMSGLVFSTPERKYSYVPLRAPRVEDIVELAASWGFDEGELVEMTTAMAIGTRERPFGFARPIYPSFRVKGELKKRSTRGTPEASEGQSRRKLTEKPYNPSDYVNYTGIPYHLQVMDSIEGEGWGHVRDEARHSVFSHENHPGVEVHVVRRDEHPIWTVKGLGGDREGSDIQELHTVLGDVPYNDPIYPEVD